MEILNTHMENEHNIIKKRKRSLSLVGLSNAINADAEDIDRYYFGYICVAKYFNIRNDFSINVYKIYLKEHIILLTLGRAYASIVIITA